MIPEDRKKAEGEESLNTFYYTIYELFAICIPSWKCECSDDKYAGLNKRKQNFTDQLRKLFNKVESNDPINNKTQNGGNEIVMIFIHTISV